MKKVGQYILARLEERSTWAGGGAGAVLILSVIPGTEGQAIVGICAAVAALLAIVLPTGGQTP